MDSKTLVIVEPNKIGRQHNTFNKEFLNLFKIYKIHFISDIRTSKLIDETYYQSSESIKVIDGDERKFIKKTIFELFNVIKLSIKYRKNKILFLSISPQVLFIFEFLKLFIAPKKKIYIILHGELEGVFEKDKQKINSYGFWIMLWLKLRKSIKTTKVILLAEYIYDSINNAGFNFGRINDDISIVNLPIPFHHNDKKLLNEKDNLDFLFIGQRSKKKGFIDYLSIKNKTKSYYSFYSIGQGKLIHHSKNKDIHSNFQDYMDTVSNFSVFIFPVIGSYQATISSAICDAIGCSQLILAYKNPMTEYFQRILSEECVILFNSEEELVSYIDNIDLNLIRMTVQRRSEIISKSCLSSNTNKMQAMRALNLKNYD